MRNKNFRAAVFDHYCGNWDALVSELEKLAEACGSTPESVSMFMKGFDRSLPRAGRVELCRYLGLDPRDYPELRASYRTLRRNTNLKFGDGSK